MSEVAFDELVGKTIDKIDVFGGDEELRFTVKGGDQYRLYHDQDCCESVTIEDICGDLDDLIGVPVLMAADLAKMRYRMRYSEKQTIKGTVVIRWLGESNGYYSESVSFELVEVDA